MADSLSDIIAWSHAQMQSADVDIVGTILAMEEARHEENKRVNADRELIRALAPDRWRELKDAFRTECGKLTARSHRLQFECEEPDAQTFYVNRMVGDVAVRALAFTFDPRVPRIVYEKLWGSASTGHLDFVATGSNVLFASGNSGVILSEFMLRIMMQITR